MHELWHIVFPTDVASMPDDFAARATPVYGTGRTASGETADISSWTSRRRSITVPAGAGCSTGAYYNAFPASYWAHWTDVRTVTLTGSVTGSGTVRVLASDRNGDAHEVASQHAQDATVSFEVSIAGMEGGGCLWVDLAADANGPMTFANGVWGTATPKPRNGTMSLSITTMNKPEWCIRQFNLLADAGDLSLVDAIYVIDQGTRLVQDEPGFEQVRARLGDKLHIIRQRNIGGSGGFARGMAEISNRNDSGYALLLDDDTVLEPESISRAVAFANYCKRPSIVGGAMLFLTEPTRICAMAEVFNREYIRWEQAPGSPRFADLAAHPFTQTPYLHQRWDADYNAWWMCLIPVQAIREIGLSYPFFIKNDDVEYGIRAGMVGYPTITLPGVCLWHQSWADKDDILDWQAYFHIRNKLIMGLLYSRRPWGGRLLPAMMRSSLSATAKMRYSAVKLHRMAVTDVMRGAEYIGDILESRLPEIRAARAVEPDAQPVPLAELPDTLLLHDPAEVERVASQSQALVHMLLTPPRRDRRTVIDGYVEPMRVWWLTEGAERHRRVPGKHFDQLTLVTDDPSIHWRALARMDSAVTVGRGQSTGTLLVRRPWKAFTGLVGVAGAYMRLALSWRKYQSAYRKTFNEMVSPEWWSKYFNRPVD